jgi:hypothetical protein
MSATDQPVRAWHFLPADRLVRPGQCQTVEPPLELCHHGLHVSVRALDALQYAPGPVVCRVECSGEILHGDDRLCATRLRALWMNDATTVLHRFACDCAEDALKDAKVEDERYWRAIQVKRLWLEGKASGEDLRTARDAAWAAAWAARDAGKAARDAVWGSVGAFAWDARVAARVAVWAAARAAVWAATRAAAGDSARAAAWAAFRDCATLAAGDSARAADTAAWAAARAAEASASAAARDAQNTRLESLLMELSPDTAEEACP